ncbi:MAG: phosphoribosyltransferase family protein [Gammaproteobacteria bacterium]|nr:phosphoribosyltransferase family protein [Gammaproteobacteria bacterium]
MLSEDKKHLFVSDREYHQSIEKLAVQIHLSHWDFDIILCLARGGMRPGDIISRIFDKPLAIISTSSYRVEHGTVQGELDIAKHITSPRGEIAGRVLLVDDLADTGHTLTEIVAMIKRKYPAITELRTAVIWVKQGASFHPDYYTEFLPTAPWIHQPFECYDTTRPNQLVEKYQAVKGAEVVN